MKGIFLLKERRKGVGDGKDNNCNYILMRRGKGKDGQYARRC